MGLLSDLTGVALRRNLSTILFRRPEILDQEGGDSCISGEPVKARCKRVSQKSSATRPGTERSKDMDRYVCGCRYGGFTGVHSDNKRVCRDSRQHEAWSELRRLCFSCTNSSFVKSRSDLWLRHVPVARVPPRNGWRVLEAQPNAMQETTPKIFLGCTTISGHGLYVHDIVRILSGPGVCGSSEETTHYSSKLVTCMDLWCWL